MSNFAKFWAGSASQSVADSIERGDYRVIKCCVNCGVRKEMDPKEAFMANWCDCPKDGAR